MNLLALIEQTGDLGLANLRVSGFGLIVVLLLAALLFALLRAARWLLGLVPLTKLRRAALARFRPVFEALAVVVYVLLAVPVVFEGHDEFTPLVLVALLFGLVGVSWFAIRDFINGMFIKAGELCEVGDRLTADEHTGVVKRLGARVLTLETDGGDEVVIPYGQLTRRSIVRSLRVEGAYRHGFALEIPAGLDPVAAIAQIKRLAMDSHWASVVRAPEVEIVDGRRLFVHVFALSREHGPAIEAMVRAGSTGAGAGPRNV